MHFCPARAMDLRILRCNRAFEYSKDIPDHPKPGNYVSSRPTA